ncbi:MAG: sigma-B/F/G subfamily polymerase sigma-28 factor, polymerase sigma-B factor, partial [Armatimonadetes bacterium]|nr:sigma-B/F/G subfamily polymerase sigma-28 factor, polymerase sigma-B factor [Armatimonadota bacterium]
QVTRVNDVLAQKLGRSPTVAEIAEHVGCTEEDALKAMELGNAYETVSLDTRLALDGDAALTLSDSIGVQDLELDQVDSYDDLKTALERLEPREKLIIYLRYFQDLSQTEVARRLKISQMHVSRLQHKALKRLKEIMDADRAVEIGKAA